MDKRLREAYAWSYLGKWYVVIIRAWQGHGDMVILDTLFTQEYSCSIINLIVKKTRHEANMKKLIVETEKVYLEYPFLCLTYGGVYFIWCMSLCDIGY